jgi:hypothetical protein
MLQPILERVEQPGHEWQQQEPVVSVIDAPPLEETAQDGGEEERVQIQCTSSSRKWA